jgi:hypothetical protein
MRLDTPVLCMSHPDMVGIVEKYQNHIVPWLMYLPNIHITSYLKHLGTFLWSILTAIMYTIDIMIHFCYTQL